MEPQSIVVIQDSTREVNLRIFEWALNSFLLGARDKLTLAIVLHEVITPMGYKSRVDSNNMIGANQRVIEEEVNNKKKKYLKDEGLIKIFNLYQSRKVEFNIEVAIGTSPRDVALKISKKMNATWLILDRKMKNDGDYFLNKLSCGISRIRRHNKIMHLRGRPALHQNNQDHTHDSIPVSMPDSVPESTPDEPFYRPKINPDKAECSNRGEDSEETSCAPLHFASIITKKPLEGKLRRDGDLKMISTLGGSKSTMEDQESSEFLSYCGAKSFYHGRAEEYQVCEQVFHFC
ncbi:hypothetical protein HN51_034133 [Arachis hypogaea]|uniref:uncharacterized protein LOC107634101 n=1 Tax=Arachis ipaensis TaxID=130454 RepID=UPI0007AFCF54|nr:uncharacterized protein LOC107634101 [Arachis ipaensis]XP_025642047.1 uncharacterized protein LOC112736702 [Arachis hypogaea]QHN98938.1 uncharacterized protein DS421_13g393680 [Arachis hypogaea]